MKKKRNLKCSERTHLIIEAIKKQLDPGVKKEADVTGEKIVDLKWAEVADICEALKKEGYQLHWYKEDKVERKLGEGWMYLETHKVPASLSSKSWYSEKILSQQSPPFS